MKKTLFSKTYYVVILFLFYLPVLTVLGACLWSGEARGMVGPFLRSPEFQSALFFSVREALASAICSLILALPGAYFFGHYDFYGKKLWRSLMMLPFMMPAILIVLGMVACFGVNGSFNQMLAWILPQSGWKFTALYGFYGIVLANTYYNFSFCLRVIGESWERINPAYEEAATLLGESRWGAFRRIVLPLLSPTLAYLFMMVFLYSFLSFTVVLVLGGFLYKTLEVLIYIEYNSRLQFDRAGMMAGIQMILLAGVVSLQFCLRRNTLELVPSVRKLPWLSYRNKRLAWGVFTAYKILILMFFFSPLLSMVIRSLKMHGMPDGSFTLQNYLTLGGDAFRFAVGQELTTVLVTSLGTALTVGLLTSLLAYSVADLRRKLHWNFFDLCMQLPMGISFLTFAFGILRLFGEVLSSWFLIVWAQVFLAFPLTYSVLRTARRELGDSLTETATLLGAHPLYIWSSIEMPLMRKAFGTAFAFAVAFSLGDFGAVSVLGRGEICTLSVAIYRMIGHYHYAQATALGTIFMVLSVAIYFLIEQRYLPGVVSGNQGDTHES